MDWCGNECPASGICPRFQIKMPPAWMVLCQTKPEYRKLWEEGRGPGQVLVLAVNYSSASVEVPAGKPVVPPIAERVVNLTKALASFVADGCKTVSAEEYRTRLEICLTPEGDSEHCANLIREQICGKIGGCGCGCYVAVKAKGRAWDCPRVKWPKIQNSV